MRQIQALACAIFQRKVFATEKCFKRAKVFLSRPAAAACLMRLADGIFFFFFVADFPLQSWLLCNAHPACQLANSLAANLTETYRGTSLIRNCLLLGPYRRPMPRTLQCT